MQAHRIFWYDSPERFSYVECLNCGCVYLRERPTIDEIRLYYPPEKQMWRETWQYNLVRTGVRGRYIPTNPVHSFLGWALDKVFLLPPKDSPQPRLLDIGGGNFKATKAYSEAGFECYGIDINPETVAFARNTLGLDVRQEPFEATSFPANHFDIVLMHHVLEHLYSPRNSLRQARRILKDEGYLVVEVPNSGGWSAQKFREMWGFVGAPQHTWLPDPQTLAHLLQEEGFHIVRWLSAGIPWTSAGWHVRMIARKQSLSTFSRFALVARAAFLYPLAHTVLRVFWPSRAINMGDVISVLACKAD